MFRLKAGKGLSSFRFRIEKLPIILMQKNQQPSTTPSRIPAAKQQVGGEVRIRNDGQNASLSEKRIAGNRQNTRHPHHPTTLPCTAPTRNGKPQMRNIEVSAKGCRNDQ